MNKKIAFMAAFCSLALPGMVYAQTQNEENIKADVNALDKDNAALHEQHKKLSQDRAAKEQDKASGSYGKQAVDSMKIGADKAAIGEKETERDIHKKILKHHKKKDKQAEE